MHLLLLPLQLFRKVELGGVCLFYLSFGEMAQHVVNILAIVDLNLVDVLLRELLCGMLEIAELIHRMSEGELAQLTIGSLFVALSEELL